MFIYVSSTGVYGDADGNWVDETTPPSPVDESGQICLDAEQTLTTMANERGIPWCVLRLAGIYGPNRLLAASTIQAGEPIPGDPDAFLNLIHVDDAVTAIDLAARSAKTGEIYNVADGQPGTRREFYQELARQLDAPPPTFSGTAKSRIRGNRRVSAAKARSQLEFHPRFSSFRDGLGQSLSWR
jgi:nucleoside-diphosphate-sugar epimerase